MIRESSTRQVHPSSTSTSESSATPSYSQAYSSQQSTVKKLPILSFLPHQPDINYPYTMFGKTPKDKRQFQFSWFKRWPWLNYNEDEDSVYCHTCIKAIETHSLSVGMKIEDSFIFKGFKNWKNALDTKKGFSKHSNSIMHKEATSRYVIAPQTSLDDVDVLLSRSVAQEKEDNQNMLLTIISTLKYIGRQSSSARGTWCSETGNEKNSNFYQLLLLRSLDNAKILKWLEKKSFKYISPVIQNELFKIMGTSIIREHVADIIKAKWFTIMADETTDVANTEQLVVCIRWIDDNFQPNEDFIGLYAIENTSSDMLVCVIIDVLLRLGLEIEDCRGQCYDGAAFMSGVRNGVATQIKRENSKALYTHCYGHALNLAVGDVIKSIKLLKDTLDVTFEIVKLIKKSPNRESKFEKIKEEAREGSVEIRNLCPTRWTVRAEALHSILTNYKYLFELWEWSLEKLKDTEMKARVLGVKSYMRLFKHFFGCKLGVLVLKHTDNLSKALQSPNLTAATAQEMAQNTIKSLQRYRTDQQYELFWKSSIQEAKQNSIDDPTLPRKRKLPARFEEGNPSSNSFPATAKNHYKQIYLETLDVVISTIQGRFNQPDYQIYSHAQQLLIKSMKQDDISDELEAVCKFYGNDLNKFDLCTQLESFSMMARDKTRNHEELPTFLDIVEILKNLDSSKRIYVNEVCLIMKLLLLAPATNATSERMLSALKRIKTCLRNSCGQARLNHLMAMHVYRDDIDEIDPKLVAREFVGQNEKRLSLFGRF